MCFIKNSSLIFHNRPKNVRKSRPIEDTKKKISDLSVSKCNASFKSCDVKSGLSENYRRWRPSPILMTSVETAQRRLLNNYQSPVDKSAVSVWQTVVTRINISMCKVCRNNGFYLRIGKLNNCLGRRATWTFTWRFCLRLQNVTSPVFCSSGVVNHKRRLHVGRGKMPQSVPAAPRTMFYVGFKYLELTLQSVSYYSGTFCTLLLPEAFSQLKFHRNASAACSWRRSPRLPRRLMGKEQPFPIPALYNNVFRVSAPRHAGPVLITTSLRSAHMWRININLVECNSHSFPYETHYKLLSNNTARIVDWSNSRYTSFVCVADSTGKLSA